MEKELKKELEKKIVELLKEGYDKKTVFEELKQTSRHPIELAKLIQKYPTEENKKKYKSQNRLLIILLSITLIFDLIALSYGAIIWDIILINFVSKFNANQYQWISFRAGFSVVVLALFFFMSDFSMLNLISITISLIVLIPTLILAAKLKKKLCPEFEEKKITEINENGKASLKLKIEFAD